MIRVYSRLQAFKAITNLSEIVFDKTLVWLDLDNPTPEEEAFLEKNLHIDLPTREEMRDIEISSRLYQDKGATYMTATLLCKADTDEPETTNVTFILAKDRLVTIRYADPKPFSAFQTYTEKHQDVCNTGTSTLLALLEATVDRTAELLERSGNSIDLISKSVFSRKRQSRKMRRGDNLETLLTDIAFHQNMVTKIRESLVSVGRLTGFLALADEIQKNAEMKGHVETVRRDIQALTEHTSFVTGNVNFLLDAALGLINVEQNAIIKIFSIASVVLLPPTLVASVYGMNFNHMPELGWTFGYPLALVMMLLSAVLPYLFFKWRGWL